MTAGNSVDYTNYGYYTHISLGDISQATRWKIKLLSRTDLIDISLNTLFNTSNNILRHNYSTLSQYDVLFNFKLYDGLSHTSNSKTIKLNYLFPPIISDYTNTVLKVYGTQDKIDLSYSQLYNNIPVNDNIKIK